MLTKRVFFLLTKRVITKRVFVFAHETSAHETSVHETSFFIAHETSADETFFFEQETSAYETSFFFFCARNECSRNEFELVKPEHWLKPQKNRNLAWNHLGECECDCFSTYITELTLLETGTSKFAWVNRFFF